MRNLEKGLLLAELIDPSLTSKEQIDELVDWIRKQDSYIKLVESMMEIKKSSTFLAINTTRFITIYSTVLCY